MSVIVKVLITENCQRTRLMLEKEISLWGYKTFSACDGAETLAAMVEHSPRILVIDRELPKLDGCEVVKAIRELENDRRTHVIMTCRRQSPDAINEAFAGGIDDYLPKPYGLADLKARIRSGFELLNRIDGVAYTCDELDAKTFG